MAEEGEVLTSAQKAAMTAETGLHSLGGVLGDAANEKIEEYARRILAGEDPKTMGVPGNWQAEVGAKVNALSSQKGPSASGPTGIDFGTADEGTPRAGIEGHKILATGPVGVSQQFDPLSQFPETKPDNSLLGKVRAKIEQIRLSRKLNS